MNYEPRTALKKAASGFEPEHRGFADLRLTTWLSRRLPFDLTRLPQVRKPPLPQVSDFDPTPFKTKFKRAFPSPNPRAESVHASPEQIYWLSTPCQAKSTSFKLQVFGFGFNPFNPLNPSTERLTYRPPPRNPHPPHHPCPCRPASPLSSLPLAAPGPSAVGRLRSVCTSARRFCGRLASIRRWLC